jgi:Protein of unknown function (DUF2889)
MSGVDFAASPRRPDSIRRTTTHDSTRPAGLRGPVTLVAQGRDLFTGHDDTEAVLDQGRVELRADFREGTIIELSSDPAEPALVSLVGSSPFSGFRAKLEALLPGERTAHTVRFRLLYDLAPAVLVSGRALRAAGVRIEVAGRSSRSPVDICAGWAEGGTLLEGLTEDGPPLHIGPDVDPLSLPGDPLAWHATTPLPVHSTRRSRRLDLWEDDGVVRLEAYFRDSHVDGDGRETVVHEYGVRGALDPVQEQFLWCHAVPGTLPYPECPGAAESAERLAGVRSDNVTAIVRQGLVGPSTCTHLNDTFRCLEDTGALTRLLRQSALRAGRPPGIC